MVTFSVFSILQFSSFVHLLLGVCGFLRVSFWIFALDFAFCCWICLDIPRCGCVLFPVLLIVV